MASADLIVGIDLGTTFSLIAYVDDAGPHVVRDARGDGRVPSVIAVAPPDGGGSPRVTVGWSAREHAVENPRATVYSVKRLIGKGIADVEAELPFLAYAVRSGPRDTLQVEIDGRLYTPEEISSVILRTLKERAEQALGRPVTKAVVTVPAYFDDAQRQATRTAGQAAGLDVVRIINEPTAAALAYGIGARGAPQAGAASHVSLPVPHCHDVTHEGGGVKTQTVAIYDLGGGTFDVSILRLENDVFQVLSTAGDTHLGGDDFDRLLITLVQREVHEQFGVTIDSPATKQALRTLAEQIKIRLTDEPQAQIEMDLGKGRVYRRTVTREAYEQLCGPLVARSIALCEHALRDAGLGVGDLDQMILVGGSSRMPIVRRRVAEFFGRQPYAALNPDEVVAIGAAIQASLLSGQRRDLLLLDVTPLSLGLETMGGAMAKLILRNTTIPCRATEQFTTFVDGQTAIKLNVLQGERELAEDCRVLGEFELRGIPPMPAGIPKVEVEFLIDANGILNVAAKEQRSGQHASIQIIPNHGLTKSEVERVMRESLTHARQDLDAHRRIDLLNQVEFDTTKTEQMLARVGNLLPAGERTRIESEIAALRALAKDTTDLDVLYQRLTEFGHGTIRLAELGVREALVEAQRGGSASS